MSNNNINEAGFVAVIWVCLVLGSCFVVTRLILQYRVDRRWRTDDFLVLAAWILYLANGILWTVIYKQLYYIMAVSKGTISLADLPLNIEWIERRYLRGQLAGYLISYTSLWLIKLSFVFFFQHLGNRYRLQRILWWAVLAFVIASYGVTLVNCSSAHSIWYERVSLKVATSMDIVSDAAIILLSGNVMWRAKVNRPKKLGLVAVSFLTAFIIVISLIRLFLSVGETGIMNPAWLVFWNVVEVLVALAAVSGLSFFTFYTKLKKPRSTREYESFDSSKRWFFHSRANYSNGSQRENGSVNQESYQKNDSGVDMPVQSQTPNHTAFELYKVETHDLNIQL
ncbi:uncharacterized protein N7484_009803 [Penicillium longicatenatum]|uniref:uncharacterized protein n=1 Tax=Penicillium longicatenatum TaxID=1561947 RepID=UPI00254968BA|nr:uncharacterized protein N7484_009803 [Penicillium longicatenatum]KAJ5636490.1 hypothetical protein N7484_009803 [Penicillium longicatenatum]